jgi:protein-disulfide isomerase
MSTETRPPAALTVVRNIVTGAVSLGSLFVLGIAQGSSPTQATGDEATAPLSNHTVVAIIGRERVTEADVASADRSAFEKQEEDYNLKLRQLQVRRQQARHELLEKRLDQQLDQRALSLEAKARGTTTDAVLADLKVPAVTEQEARRFYEDNKTRTRESFEQLEVKITEHLASEHNEEATRSFYDALRQKYGIKSTLEPYRLAVDASGPSLGKADAPVTIVEFADFQCPYCREAEDTLRTVMGRYPDQVRLVFRNLPLPNLHPNATIAAEAGVCADRQGMFWQMHDLMFRNQSALSEGALKDTAKSLGLQVDGFSACLADPQTSSRVDSDRKAADELAIAGTPYFFINGRPLNGSVPVERFESLISDELRRASPKADVAKRDGEALPASRPCPG